MRLAWLAYLLSTVIGAAESRSLTSTIKLPIGTVGVERWEAGWLLIDEERDA
jgi:hypothetical protein